MSDEDYAKRENTYKQFKMMKQKVSFYADICHIGLMSGFLWCNGGDTILALVCMLRVAHQLLLMLPTLSGMQQQSPCFRRIQSGQQKRSCAKEKGSLIKLQRGAPR